MVPTFRHSISSLMPLDLNEDQNHELSSPNKYHSSSSFSSASLSYPDLLLHPPDQDQEISYYSNQSKPLQYEEAEKIIPSSGSWDDSAAENQQSSHKRKLTVWRKERSENLQVQAAAAEPEGGGTSVKWLSSKMRMMRKMVVSDHQHKFEDDHKLPLSSPLGTDTSSSNNNNYSNHLVRVCSDCHTTKTPLWRSGPRGPKSLCNACGIRQRKARRAMAAAAAADQANGTTVVATETTVKKNKLQQKKENKSKIEFSSSTHMNKKKRKLVVGWKPISDVHSQSSKKLGFEDLRLSLSKNLALQQVFPQDEKEAAILLMALSYGLVHG